MCGRYTLHNLEQLLRDFPGVEIPAGVELKPRYNIAPTQPVLAVANDRPDRFTSLRWGLIPSWAKDPSVGNRMINARAETLASKPAFRTALRRRRCLVPADGFYEWKAENGKDGKAHKTPMYARMKGGVCFAFAGLWEAWRGPDGSEVRSCTLITTTPNTMMGPIHDRMPVVLPREAYAAWLDSAERPAEDLVGLLKPYPPAEMEAFPVSRAVNSPANESAQCVVPA